MGSRSGPFPVRPTKHALAFAGVLLALWYAAASQSNAVAHLLFFFVLGTCAVSVVRGWANLCGLEIRTPPEALGSVGRPGRVAVELVNRSRGARWALEIGFVEGGRAKVARLDAGHAAAVTLGLPALPRGSHPMRAVRVETRFPFGLARCVSHLPCRLTYDVAPEPRGVAEFPGGGVDAEGDGHPAESGGDDFSGHRAFQAGDPPRHLDWKALARGGPALLKLFTALPAGSAVFSLAQTPGGTLEERLSQLALWVDRAAEMGSAFTLDLGGGAPGTGAGSAHREECLRALARYREGGSR